MMRLFPRTFACLAVAACLPGCVPYVRTYAPAASGQVFDARSHRPVEGVRVYTKDYRHITAETRTASDGSFELPARTGLSLYLPWQGAFAAPHLVVEPGAQGPQTLTVDYEPTWLPLENATRYRPPSSHLRNNSVR